MFNHQSTLKQLIYYKTRRKYYDFNLLSSIITTTCSNNIMCTIISFRSNYDRISLLRSKSCLVYKNNNNNHISNQSRINYYHNYQNNHIINIYNNLFINNTTTNTIRTISYYTNPTYYQEYNYKNSLFHEKVTNRILNTNIGELNYASLLELTTAISSWHSYSISNKYDTFCFYQAKSLLYRLLDEYIASMEQENIQHNDILSKQHFHDTNNNKMKMNVIVPIDTINLVLDSWRIINNSRWAEGKKNKIGLNDDYFKFAKEGMDIVKRCSDIALKYESSTSHTNNHGSTIIHPDSKSFNIVLDGFSKLGMVEEATYIFELMDNLAKNKNQVQCRPDKISYNTYISAFANSNQNQVENAQRASDILNDMLNLYSQTGNPDNKPDIITFATVISAYVNAAPYSSDAPYQAETLVQSMIDMYNSSLVDNGGDGEWIDLKPNDVCFTSLISAWSNSGLNESVDRAANIFMFMQTVYQGANNATMSKLPPLINNVDNNINITTHEGLVDKMLSVLEQSGEQSSMLSVLTYTTLIDCLAQSAGQNVGGDGGNAAIKAELLLQKMEELYQAGNDQLKPTTAIYNALINTWAKSMRPDAGKKAESLLEKMEYMHLSGHNGIKPDTITFSSTILAYANANSGQDAERIFMRMYDLYKSGEDDCKPNSITFSAVLNSYSNQGQPKEVERLFDLVKKLEGLESFEFDPYCVNCVLKAYIRSTEKGSTKMTLNYLEYLDEKNLSDSVSYTAVMEKLFKEDNPWAIEKAEELLSRMWQLYGDGNVKMKPTTTVYNSLINVVAKSNDPNISRRSLDLLNSLLQRYHETKDLDLMPNTVTFNTALSAFAKGSNKDDVSNAETILEQMKTLHNNGFSSVKPNAFTLTNMISCYAHSNENGSAIRAEEILQQMQEMYEEHGDESMMPTKASFGAVLNAWAREGNAYRAQAIVDHMETLQDVHREMSANTVIYNTLINSWSKSRLKESGKRAEEILEKMQEMYKNGNDEVKPSRITYNSVISAHQTSGKDAFESSKRILHQMEESEDQSIQPDVVTYTAFLNIVSKYNNHRKIEISEQILEKMNKRDLRPNNFTYDAVLRVCLFTNAKNYQITRKALILAVKTMSAIQESPLIIPTSYTYSLFFSILAKHSTGKEQEKLLHRTLNDCCKSGLLTDSILHQLMENFRPHFIGEILECPIENISSICIKNLPPEWSLKSDNKLPSASSQRLTVQSQHHTGRTRIKRR